MYWDHNEREVLMTCVSIRMNVQFWKWGQAGSLTVAFEGSISHHYGQYNGLVCLPYELTGYFQQHNCMCYKMYVLSNKEIELNISLYASSTLSMKMYVNALEQIWEIIILQWIFFLKEILLNFQQDIFHRNIFLAQYLL